LSQNAGESVTYFKPPVTLDSLKFDIYNIK